MTFPETNDDVFFTFVLTVLISIILKDFLWYTLYRVFY